MDVRTLATRCVWAFLTPFVTTGYAADLQVVSKRHDAPYISTAGNGTSLAPAISTDGQVVAFASDARNLSGMVPPVNRAAGSNVRGIYVVAAGTPEPITPAGNSLSSDPSLSGDGRFVAFTSFASNLIDPAAPLVRGENIFVYDRTLGVMDAITNDLQNFSADISDDGQRIAFNREDGGIRAPDTYVYFRGEDRLQYLDTPLNVSSGAPTMSRSGRYVLQEALPARDRDRRYYVLHDLDDGSRVEIGTDLLLSQSGMTTDAEKIVFVLYEDRSVSGDRAPGIYLWDRATAELEPLLADYPGRHLDPRISADGNQLLFQQFPDGSFLPEDRSQPRLRVLNLATGEVRVLTDPVARPGVSPATRHEAEVSGDLRRLVFRSVDSFLDGADPNGLSDVFLEDFTAETVEKVSSAVAYPIEGANGDGRIPHVSRDGRWLVYQSSATNVVSGSADEVDDNGVGVRGASSSDVYLFDTLNDATIKVTAGPGRSGAMANVSEGGAFVSFLSRDDFLGTQAPGTVNSLSQIFLWERATNTYVQVTQGTDGTSFEPHLSADGNILVFRSGASDLLEAPGERCTIYRYVRVTGITDCVPGVEFVDSFALSGDGKHLVVSYARDEKHLRVINLATGAVVSAVSNGTITQDPQISHDGRFVVFASNDAELIDGRSYPVPQIFVWDALDSSIELITAGSIHYNRWPAISGNGRFVSFWSQDPELDADDPNGDWLDVFLVDRETSKLSLLTRDANDQRVDLQYAPGMDFTGRVVAFETRATNLAPVDWHAYFNVLRYDNPDAAAENTAPVAFDQSLSVTQDNVLSLTLAGEDAEGAALAFVIVDGPEHGVLSGTAPDLLYEPEAGYTGPDQFTYLVNDGESDSAVATIIIDVLAVPIEPPVNQPPVALAQNLATELTDPLGIVLMGSDPEGLALSYEIAQPPAFGVLSGEAPELVYTPNPGFAGDDAFRFAVVDAEGLRDEATIRVAIGRGAPVASVLPSSRSVQVGETATVFAAIINPFDSTALGCYPAVGMAQPVTGWFQPTDPATNAPIDERNVPIDIPPGAAGTFILGVEPQQAFPLTPIRLDFRCANTGDARSVIGINTLALAASAQPAPDLIAMALTPTGDGVLALPGDGSYAAMSLATVNVGADAEVQLAGSLAPALSGTVLVCETNSATGACLQDPVAAVTLDASNGQTASFGVFVRSEGSVAFDPANNRVVLEFLDTASGQLAGSTSVAVRTE